MSTAVCTLFEKDYHFGVAALCNSLYRRGFRGTVFAGYRGPLPGWADKAEAIDWFKLFKASRLSPAEGLEIIFCAVESDFHFTKYKPSFMLALFSEPSLDISDLFYFDPDIVVKTDWKFYDLWVEHGVAVVHEIIGHIMPQGNPIRKRWEGFINESGRQVTNRINYYLNSGFCGLKKQNAQFLEIWKQYIELAATGLGKDPASWDSEDKTHLFFRYDQNAFNMAAMSCDCPVSEVGPEGMDFIGGGAIMSHATWKPKPWSKKFLSAAFRGISPSRQDRSYWRNVRKPINVYGSGRKVKSTLRKIMFAAFIGRFYRRAE